MAGLNLSSLSSVITWSTTQNGLNLENLSLFGPSGITRVGVQHKKAPSRWRLPDDAPVWEELRAMTIAENKDSLVVRKHGNRT